MLAVFTTGLDIASIYGNPQALGLMHGSRVESTNGNTRAAVFFILGADPLRHTADT